MIHAYVPYAETADQELASPIAGGLLRRMMIVVNADRDPAALTPWLRREIAAVDPHLRWPGSPRWKTSCATPRHRSGSAPPCSPRSPLVPCCSRGSGCHGVLAFSVAHRTREIGLRVALGAPRGMVVGLVVRQGMVLVGIGLALGVPAPRGHPSAWLAPVRNAGIRPVDLHHRPDAAVDRGTGGVFRAGATRSPRGSDGRAANAMITGRGLCMGGARERQPPSTIASAAHLTS